MKLGVRPHMASRVLSQKHCGPQAPFPKRRGGVHTKGEALWLWGREEPEHPSPRMRAAVKEESGEPTLPERPELSTHRRHIPMMCRVWQQDLEGGGCPRWEGRAREGALGFCLAGQKDTLQGTGASVAPWPTSRLQRQPRESLAHLHVPAASSFLGSASAQAPPPLVSAISSGVLGEPLASFVSFCWLDYMYLFVLSGTRRERTVEPSTRVWSAGLQDSGECQWG